MIRWGPAGRGCWCCLMFSVMPLFWHRHINHLAAAMFQCLWISVLSRWIRSLAPSNRMKRIGMRRRVNRRACERGLRWYMCVTSGFEFIMRACNLQILLTLMCLSRYWIRTYEWLNTLDRHTLDYRIRIWFELCEYVKWKYNWKSDTSAPTYLGRYITWRTHVRIRKLIINRARGS